MTVANQVITGTFRDSSPPDANRYVIPIPRVDDIWSDTTAHLVKRCTSTNPYTWVSIEGAGGGASATDNFVTWSANGDLVNEKVIGTFLTSILQTALPFARGGSILSPSAPVNVMVWRAPFACTVTNVRGYVVGSTGSTVNARRNGTDNHLSSDLTLGSTDTWLDGGSVQNVAYVAGDKLEIMFVSLSGSPSQVDIQVDFTRP